MLGIGGHMLARIPCDNGELAYKKTNSMGGEKKKEEGTAEKSAPDRSPEHHAHRVA